MGPGGESVGVGIKKDHRQRQRRKQQRQAIQLGSRKNENPARNQNECAHERRRQPSDWQSASSSAGIGSVNRGVRQPIESHGGGARRDHGDDDPPRLPPSRQSSGGQHSSAERKRKREDRELPLDHLQSDLQISEKSHELIVKQRMLVERRASPPGHPKAGRARRLSTVQLVTRFLPPAAQTGNLRESLPRAVR